MPEAESEKKKDSNVVRAFKLLLKLAVTILCFWYISTKIDFSEAWHAFTKANWFYLSAALLFFLLSKILSAIRLNIYFKNIGLHLPVEQNLRLYWLGMFYNLFLPGAISGDAYKVVLLHRRYGNPYKKLSAAVLLDRFSGVLALGVILALYGVVVLKSLFLQLFFAAGALAAIAIFYLAVKKLFPYFIPGFWSTFSWGLGVQVSQVVCIYLILYSIGLAPQPEWIFIFLLSAVVSILPISLGGGLGTREVVFAEGARYFGLNPQLGIVVSLLFYLLTVLGSMWGLVYQFRSPFPKPEVREQVS